METQSSCPEGLYLVLLPSTHDGHKPQCPSILLPPRSRLPFTVLHLLCCHVLTSLHISTSPWVTMHNVLGTLITKSVRAALSSLNAPPVQMSPPHGQLSFYLPLCLGSHHALLASSAKQPALSVRLGKELHHWVFPTPPA